jgi:hypothetical protein
MSRPRAADDFAVIRARIEELRRERDQATAEPAARPHDPRLNSSPSGGPKHDTPPRRLPPAIRRALFGN